MSEVNPYASPVADMGYVPDEGADGYEIAGRGTRLGAVIMESVVVFAALIPGFILFFISGSDSAGEELGGMGIAGMVYIIIVGLTLFVVNVMFLSKYQQTIGKRIMKIKIVRKDGSQCGFWRIVGLRMFVVGLIGSIPMIGPLFSLIDPLMIFRASNYCLHDDIADTIVVRVNV